MTPSLDVVFRDIDSSAALTQTITEKYEKLSRFSDLLGRSRVVLNTPHQHNGKKRIFRASIEMNLKGSPVVITHDHESIHIAVRDAFTAAERKIKSVTHKARSQKHH